MTDDLVLLLDDTGDVTLDLDIYDTLILEDSVPYPKPIPEFEGPYTVIPVLYNDQELETSGMKMIDNVLVKEIPITQTSNPYGGYTVVIG